jgi:hypothetical protein
MHYQRYRSQGHPGPSGRVKGEDNSGHTTTKGYRTVTVNGEQVLEHRFVMELILGRELLPGENVHHINGVRWDNRPANLELWVSSQPAGQRIPDLLAWADEIISRYRPLEYGSLPLAMSLRRRHPA